MAAASFTLPKATLTLCLADVHNVSLFAVDSRHIPKSCKGFVCHNHRRYEDLRMTKRNGLHNFHDSAYWLKCSSSFYFRLSCCFGFLLQKIYGAPLMYERNSCCHTSVARARKVIFENLFFDGMPANKSLYEV